MTRFNPTRFGRIVLSILGAFAFSGAQLPPSLAFGAPATAAESGSVKDPVRTNCVAVIDCVTPDGRVVAVSGASAKHSSAPALMMDDDTLCCSLQEGETTFVISFPKTPLLNRFTFVNENAGARGEVRIAVSNDRLPADSPKWTEVSGKTEFASKRLFNFSMVGVEARYVKLSFHVQEGGKLASLGGFDGIAP